MNRCVAITGLLLATAIPAQQPAAVEPVQIEIVTERDHRFVGEAIDVALHIWIVRSLLDEGLVQPFAQRLDCPVRVDAVWFDELPDTQSLEPRPGAVSRGASIVLNGDRRTATRLADRTITAQTFAGFALERRFVATAPGPLELAAATLHYDHATEFRDDFVHGRVPVDRRTTTVHSAPQLLTIVSLPTTGRPPGFGGAVGRYEVDAELANPELRVGDGAQLVLRITGEGNLPLFAAPTLKELREFHVRGWIERIDRDVRTITYDIVPLEAAATTIPSIAFGFFDPNPPATFRSVHTAALPVRVQPAADGSTTVARPSADGSPTVPEPAGDDPAPNAARPTAPSAWFELEPVHAGDDRALHRELTSWTLFAGMAAPWLVAGLLRGLAWRRWRRAIEADRRRARRAAGLFRDAVRAPGADLAAALIGYLADRLTIAPAAVVSTTLIQRLVAADVPAALATRTVATLDSLDATRYGGGPTDETVATVRALVDALDPTFRDPELRR